jgi:azurin
MKKNKFNFFVLALAVVFATASAFTTNANSQVDAETLTTGYINIPIPCQEVQVDCSLQGTKVCKYNGHNVFDKSLPTVCDIPMYRD